MPPQRLSEKVQLKKNRPKIQNCNLGQIRNVCLVNHLKVSSWKVKSCCYKNSDGKSTFNIHSTWTHDKVKGEHLKKLPKIQMLDFSQNLTQDTPSEVGWLDRWIWNGCGCIVAETQRTRFCPQTDRLAMWNQCSPLQLRWIMNIHNSIADIYNCIMGTHNYTLKLLHFQLSPLMSLWISTIRLWISIIELLVSIIEFWICIIIGYYG